MNLKKLILISAAIFAVLSVSAFAAEEKVVTMSKVTVFGLADQIYLTVTTDEKPVLPSSKLFGVFVDTVRPNSPAAQAGIRPGMILMSIKKQAEGETSESFANPKRGDRREIGEVKARLLEKAKLTTITEAEKSRGWIDLEIVLNDAYLKDSKHHGKFMVALRVNLKSDAQPAAVASTNLASTN